MASGIHTLRLVNNIFNQFGFDGILIYGGTISAAQNPSVVAYPSGISFMDGNMTNTNFPVIVAASVTPAFVVSGINSGGVNYWISYNGTAETAYVPGTAITTPGNYRVWAEAWASQWSLDTAIPEKRILGGADFDLQAPQVTSLNAAKTAVDGTSVGIINAVVSASFNGYFYIQNGYTGIQVDYPDANITLPSQVSVSGTVRTNSDGERYIDAKIVTLIAGTETVSPVCMTNQAMGGSNILIPRVTARSESPEVLVRTTSACLSHHRFGVRQ